MRPSIFARLLVAAALVAPRAASAETASSPGADAAAPGRLAMHAEGAAVLGGAGGAITPSAELQLDASLGIELSAGAIVLDDASAGTEREPSTIFTVFPGLRLFPFAGKSGPERGIWFAAGAGAAYARRDLGPVVALRGGIDIDIAAGAAGPFAGLVHLPAAREERGEDRAVFLVGLHGVLGGGRTAAAKEEPSPLPEPRRTAREEAPRTGPDTKTGVPVGSRAVAAPSTPELGPIERLRFNETVQFPVNGVRIGMSAGAVLRRVTARIRAERFLWRVVVEGHSDTSGSLAYNQRISLARANAARDFLVRLGIRADLVVVEAMSGESPLDPSRGLGASIRNRRVEIVIERRAPVPAAPPTSTLQDRLAPVVPAALVAQE